MPGYVGNERHTPQREWPVQRPQGAAEGLVMCTKLIAEYLLGLDYNIFRLLLGSGSHLEIIFPLGIWQCLKGCC